MMPEHAHADASLPQLVKLLAGEAGVYDALRSGRLDGLVLEPPDPDELLGEAMGAVAPVPEPLPASWSGRLPVLLCSREVGADYRAWPQPGVLVTVARLLSARKLPSGEREIHSSVTYRDSDGQPFAYVRRTEHDTEPEPAPRQVLYLRLRRSGQLSHAPLVDTCPDAEAQRLMEELAAIIQSQQFTRSARRIGEERAARELAETAALQAKQEEEPYWEPTCGYPAARQRAEPATASDGEQDVPQPDDDELPF